MNKENTFEADIDNQTTIKDIRNYMIGPVFAHKKHAEGDKLMEYEYDRSHPIGILQLVNKKGFTNISDYDIAKFKSIQKLIGLAIDKTSETHSTVNIRIGVGERLKEMTGIVKDQPCTEEAYGITTGDMIEIEETKNDIRKMIKYLEELKS